MAEEDIARSGRDRVSSVSARLARSVAMVLTVLSAFSLFFAYLAEDFGLTTPVFTSLWEFGRSRLSESRLLLLQIATPIVAWIAWAAVIWRARLASGGAKSGARRGGTVLSYLQNLVNIWLTNRVGNRMTTDMRVRLFRQMQRLSTVYHDTKGTTDSTYRIQNDATSLRSLSTDGVVPLITAVVTLVAMMVVMVTLDWELALIALSITPFMFLSTLVYKKRIRLGWRKVKSSESAAMSAAQESLSAARVVKAFGQEERESEQFRSRYDKTAAAALKVLVEGGIYSLIVGVVTAVGLAAVWYVGIHHVLDRTLSPGAFLMVNIYLTQLYSPLKDLGKKVLDVQMSLAGMERF